MAGAFLLRGLRLMVLAGAAALCLGAAEPLSPLEAAGRRLYTEGLGRDGTPPEARIGTAAYRAPASAVPCAGCHGPDGAGRREGNVSPADITWAELAKPYGHSHPNGRRHPPFDAASLGRAITEGLDPAGNALDPAMPRYGLGAADLEALVAYLRRLGTLADPGVEDDVLRLGSLLPADGALAGHGAAVRRLLHAYLAALNAAGGVYGRRIELRVEAYTGEPARDRQALERLAAGPAVFALLAPFARGIEPVLDDFTRRQAMPALGPITLSPLHADASNAYVFHLLPGLTELARSLGAFAARHLDLGERPLALLHAAAAPQALELGRELAARGLRTVFLAYPPGTADGRELARRLLELGAGAVLATDAGVDLAALAAALDAAGAKPSLLVPGPLASRALLETAAARRSRLFVAYPALPGERKPAALAAYARYAGSERVEPVALAAYSAALVAVEGLRRAGRELTRRKLVASLEGLKDFDTGLLPPLGFHADRRIGLMGAHVLGLDPESGGYRPVGGWIAID